MSRRVAQCLLMVALTLLVSACRDGVPVAAPTEATASLRTPVPSPTPTLSPTETALPTSTPTSVSVSAPSVAPTPTLDLVALLRANPMPASDPVALANSMQSSGPLAGQIAEPAGTHAVGDQRVFWLANVDQASYAAITATLRVQLEHIQMWVQNDVAADQEALQRSAQVFEQQIYPGVRAAFGSEWSPGIDGDPHLLVLNGSLSGAAGYFASANEYVSAVNPYSNQAEMFVMNLAALDPGTPTYESILAHELQHMIHWYQDRNESSWVNEGAAQLAEEIVGFGPPQGHIAAFAQKPDLQLTTWSDEPDQVSAHYGAAYLFIRYLYDSLGGEALRRLIAEPADGMLGLEQALAQVEGAPTAEELYADWLVANVANAESIDTRYGYEGLDLQIQPVAVSAELPVTISDSVHPFGADYYALPMVYGESLHVTLEGEPEVALLPNVAASGDYQWWSNRGDSGHSALQGRFDLSKVATATLVYDVWYDIEPGWDFAHLRISTDGGRTWQLLRAPGMTDYNPVGNALGWGYTGASGHAPTEDDASPVWVHEAVDLGDYVGQVVELRFDYITDDAVTYAGLCLDNLGIEALGFYDDAETDGAGWLSLGFIRHDNVLPQHYLVRWVEQGEGHVVVHDLPLDAAGHGAWTITPAEDSEYNALIIAGLTPGTTLPAGYTLAVEHLP